MLKEIIPTNLSNHMYFEDIKKCPICNSKISPIYISGRVHLDKSSASVYCECTSCGKPFIAYFRELTKDTSSVQTKYFTNALDYLAPIFPTNRVFDDKIANLSPIFVETYNQALSAETYNLNQIAGMGYRKSLEFLIKDYCCSKYPNDAEEICKMLLAQCINKYVDDSKIKNLAKVSVWLGNDETHYIRKFENKDINDLKRFIDTTIYFILYNLNADEADDIINS